MRDDTVREELQTKIMPAPVSRAASIPAPSAGSMHPKPMKLDPPLAPPPKRIETASIATPKTSPTLVEFQVKEPAVPEWRLQMQNAVHQRRGTASQPPQTPIAALPTLVGRPEIKRAVPGPVAQNVDPRMAAALKRIEESRKTSIAAPPLPKKPIAVPSKPVLAPAKPLQVSDLKLDAVSRGAAATAAAVARIPTPESSGQLPIPAAPVTKAALQRKMEAPAISRELPRPIIHLKRDTNKLPQMDEPIDKPSQELPKLPILEEAPEELIDIEPIRIKSEHLHIDGDVEDDYEEDIEDLAPFSMRFGAGLFDLIIAAFASMLLVAPLAFNYDDWFSPAALLTACGTLALVMFLYMTIALGFFGKTPGMRLFSLELVDATENEYPTLRQAAVNSSVFLLSLVFVGAGFLTMPFNEEKRALHDLLSGTILVKEF